MPKKREKQLGFYKGRDKAGCSEPGGLSYSDTPSSVIQNVWQTSLLFNKCVTAEEESRENAKWRRELCA